MPLLVDISDAIKGVASVKVAVANRLNAGAQAVAGEMEAIAKRDAPWTDRTGNARRTMTGFALWDENVQLLVGLAGHMSYSPDLEVLHFRKYSIIFPTVRSYAPNLMNQVLIAALKDGG